MRNQLITIVSALNNVTPGTSGDAHLAELLVGILQHHGVETDCDFTAAAGSDYGKVSAWSLGGDNGYVVAYGDNGETNYNLADDADDLGQHLIHQDLSGTDALIEQANIYGAGEVLTDAPETAEGPFTLIASRDYYGATEVNSVVTDDRGNEVAFETFAEAKAAMDDLDGDTYVTEHNEVGRPTYYIVEV